MRQAWREEAECRGRLDVDWDPEGRAGAAPLPVDEAPALAICDRCPVRPACLDWAMTLPPSSDHGIIGGTTRRDRMSMRARTLRLRLASA